MKAQTVVWGSLEVLTSPLQTDQEASMFEPAFMHAHTDECVFCECVCVCVCVCLCVRKWCGLQLALGRGWLCLNESVGVAHYLCYDWIGHAYSIPLLPSASTELRMSVRMCANDHTPQRVHACLFVWFQLITSVVACVCVCVSVPLIKTCEHPYVGSLIPHHVLVCVCDTQCPLPRCSCQHISRCEWVCVYVWHLIYRVLMVYNAHCVVMTTNLTYLIGLPMAAALYLR